MRLVPLLVLLAACHVEPSHEDGRSEVGDAAGLDAAGSTVDGPGALDMAAGPDAHPGPDGATDGSTGFDGATTPCVGSQVPGDYATIQSAAQAIGVVGGTICLAAQKYTEDVKLTSQQPVSLVGVPGTMIEGGVTVNAYAATTLHGLAIDGGGGSALYASGFGASLTVDHCSLTSAYANTSAASDGTAFVDCSSAGCAATFTHVVIGNTAGGDALRLYAGNQGQPDTFVVDGADLSSTRTGTGSALTFLAYAGQGTPAGATLHVFDSYLHDAAVGLAVEPFEAAVTVVPITVLVENDTIVNTGTGILYASGFRASSSSTFGYYNSLVVDDGVGVDLEGPYVPVFTSSNNLYFGNTTNFAGAAVDGTNDVKADPKLDTSTPPRPQAGSAAIGAGSSAYAPDHDFFGQARGSAVDIGAVQH